jgi:hypothetical protein
MVKKLCTYTRGSTGIYALGLERKGLHAFFYQYAMRTYVRKKTCTHARNCERKGVLLSDQYCRSQFGFGKVTGVKHPGI